MMHILITGASSGIGSAIAVECCKRFTNLTLYLIGRDYERLQETVKDCKLSGANVKQFFCDITDNNKLADIISRIDKIDFAFLNAGISEQTSGKEDKILASKMVIDVNLMGTINCINNIKKYSKEKEISPTIFVTSSMASMLPLSTCPAYCASKIAIEYYVNAIRPNLGDCGIKIKIIQPGFVKTPLTDKNGFKMPFLMYSFEAAKIILDNINTKKNYIIFPKRLYIMSWIISKLPRCIWDFINKFLPREKH